MSQRDYSLLKSLMALRGFTQRSLANTTKMTETTLSLKINGKGVFKQTEIQTIVELLKIEPSEIGKYFFTPKV